MEIIKTSHAVEDVTAIYGKDEDGRVQDFLSTRRAEGAKLTEKEKLLRTTKKHENAARIEETKRKILGIGEIDYYKKRLAESGYTKIADHFYELLESGDKPGKENYTLTEETKGKLPKFISKILASGHIAQVVNEKIGNKTDEGILKILFTNEDRGVVDSERNFDFFINNIEARRKEVLKNAEEVVKRVEENPTASEDELVIGTYKENLESQVREAVISLKRKGYSSFESGFDDPVDGSQYMGFNKDSTNGRIEIPAALVAELEQYGITILVNIDSDRDTLRLVPSVPLDSRPIDIDVWKEIWSRVAVALPPIGQARVNKQGKLANEFTERQDKIKNGEDVYLGYGVAFLNGRAQKMSRGEFETRAKSTAYSSAHF